MSQENVEIVRRSVEAFGGDDEEAFLQTLDPDLVWYPIEDGHTPARGIDGAKGIRQRWLDTWEGRRFRVRETLPSVDGGRLDDIVDYLTYVFAPIVLLWELGYLPPGIAGIIIAVIPLLASSYQFSQANAKTEDHSFLGFPSYWNVVAFYVVVLNLSPTITAIALVFWSIMVFVPIHYLYPSRMSSLRTLTLTLTALWLVSYGLILLQMPAPNQLLVVLSLLYMAYYFFLSVYMTLVKTQRRHVPAD